MDSLDEQFMRLAIAKAREGIEQGQTPFGACIVKDRRVIACAHNQVWSDTDITAHAEVCAIRQACLQLKSIDLSGSIIYSTCEPCPMCFSAIHWARISWIIFGADIEDAKQAGFHELEISNGQMKEMGNSGIEINSGVCQSECVALFDLWKKHGGRVY